VGERFIEAGKRRGKKKYTDTTSGQFTAKKIEIGGRKKVSGAEPIPWGILSK